MSESIEAMTSDVKAETVKTVQEALKANMDALSSTTKKIADYEKNVIKSMKERLEIFENQKSRLFAFDNIRTALFWAGCVGNVGTLFLLIYFLRLWGLSTVFDYFQRWTKFVLPGPGLLLFLATTLIALYPRK